MNPTITFADCPLDKAIESLKGPPLEALIAQMIKALKKAGYTTMKDGDWETPKELCKRIGISSMTFNRKVKGRSLPPELKDMEISRGPTGRILYLQSNLFLDNYLKGIK